MKKQALRKNFTREIRQNTGRFLSIFFIVTLGVAFFSGIRSSEPDMRYSADAYYDTQHLMDVQVIGTMGLTEGDVAAIEKVKGVEQAEGTYSADLISVTDDVERVFHVTALENTLNQINLETGDMPDKEDECLLDDQYLKRNGFKIGDTITLKSGTSQPLSDTLKTDTYTIVGSCSTPRYISFQRGSTTVGSGKVDAYLYLKPTAFSMDVYTEICVSAEGAKEKTAYTDGYEDQVKPVQKQVEEIAKNRCTKRREELVQAAEEKLTASRQELEDAKAQVADAKTQLETAMSDSQAQLAAAADKLESGNTQLKSGERQIEAGQSQIQQAQEVLSQKQAELNSAREQYDAGVAQYTKAQEAFAQTKSQTQNQLDQMQQQYEQGLAAAGGVETEDLAALRQQMEVIRAQLATGEEQLAATQSTLENTRAQLEAGQSQIDSGWAEMQTKQAQLSAAQTEVKEKKAQLQQGQADYEQAQEEATNRLSEASVQIAESEQQIAEGETRLREAQEQIDKIEMPTWYVYDRSHLSEYSEYGENAKRMRAIGRVFPALFFLVAALISLTAMTRMVEEQQMQIGTLKALGYGKWDIAKKYIYYALLATCGGSILGNLLGGKIFPYIIIVAYGIMYKYMDTIRLPYDGYYVVLSTAIAIGCTLVATMAACYRELMATPAALMRPPTPNKGKRILLERITILWKHVSFTWKSTIRNIVRYKKRFFMTVFGIGGCMGLMLFGFGLKDSITEISVLQFGQLHVYDMNIYLHEDASKEQTDALQKYLEKNKDVTGQMKVMEQTTNITVGKKDWEVYVYVPEDPDRVKDYVVLRDRKTKKTYSLDDEGVILTEKAATKLGVQPGDTITIQNAEKGDQKIKVSAICENYLYHYVYMTPALYQKLYGEEPSYSAVLVNTNDLGEQQLLRYGQKVINQEAAMSILYTYAMNDQLKDMLASLNLVIIVLIVSAGLLAFVVLYNLNNININERKRELATIKVLGFYDKEVASYVYRENVVLTFIGVLVGMGIGWILLQFVISSVETDAAMFGRHIRAISYLYASVLTVLFAMFVNLVMYFKLKKIDMVESLKSVE